MSVGVEVDNQYLFIVHRLSVSVTYRFRCGFRSSSFLRNLSTFLIFALFILHFAICNSTFAECRLAILNRNRNRLTKPIVDETIFSFFAYFATAPLL